MTRVSISPKFRNGADYGGIKRVVDAQHKWLPEWGIEVVDEPEKADVLALHATAWHKGPQRKVSHCHGLYWSNYNWAKWSERVNEEVTRCLLKADVCTAPSQWVAEAIARHTGVNCKVIGHGVDLDEWEQLDTREYILWDKTRADPVCDPRPVNVLARILPRTQFFTTIGDQTGNVEVIGVKSYEQHKPYVQHAMLYLCTARETFGIGTIEAMACGVPIVGWDWGGQADIVEHQVTGWLSPVGDYKDLAEGVRWCIANRDELSRNARQAVVDRYQWRDIIHQYAEIYEALDNQQQNDVKVSVVIPSHNLVSYLPKAIESALKQDYPKDKYEIIVVDDQSTDGSYEVAQGYEGVTVIRPPSNLYLAGALNYGIEYAKGEYIIPLDADNFLHAGALTILAGELDRHEDVDIAYGRIRFINEDGSAYKSQITDEQGISRWPPDVFSYERQLSHHNQIPSTSMYRKRVWERIGGYRRRCRTAEDADFWCRATTFHAVPQKVTDAVTFTYLVRNDSMSHVQKDWPWEEWYTNLTERKPYSSNPTISVVIPIGPGHGDQGICDALDSLMNQSFKDWECIVVDDTHDIRWLPSWVRYYRTDSPRSGTSISRNIGVSRCKGSAFLLLDADDYLEPTALEKLYNVWAQNKGNYIYSDWFKDGHAGIPINEYSFAGTLQALQHPITCLYPIEVRDSCKFDENMRYGEDWDYVLQVMTNGYCGIRVPEPLIYYRQSSGNNRNNLKDNIEQIRALMHQRYASMACGCQGVKTYQVPLERQMAISRGELVLIEYTGTGGPITYVGPETHTEYRVGADEGHRLKYVHRSDLDFFLSRTEFRIPDAATVS